MVTARGRPRPTHALQKELRARATLIGFAAILVWSSLAALTVLAAGIPPFQLTAMAFTIATLLGVAFIARRGTPLSAWLRLPPLLWPIGIAGLFGYHALYFLALAHAPPLEANLVNYLWPLLIVVFSALLPARLQPGPFGWWHLAGALLGFAGVALILSGAPTGGPNGTGASAERWLGLGAALAAAFVWSAYSVLSRLFGEVPSEAVTGFCLLTALLAAGAHLALETTVWPSSLSGWLAVLLIGLGPVGGAFYVWDHGMKHGDIRLLGAASYLTPLLSTLALVATGLGEASGRLWLACGLIIAGALLAARIWRLAGTRARQEGAGG